MGVNRRTVLLSAVGVVMLSVVSDVSLLAKPAEPFHTVDELSYPAMAAHRGGPIVNPESTMPAFRNIVANHPGMLLEMDVHRLATGELVIWHDVDVDGTLISTMTGAQWRNVTVPRPGGGTAPAAFLSEVLAEFGSTDVTMFVELKAVAARQDFIAAVWPHRSNIIVQNFNAEHASVFIRSGLQTLRLSSSYLPPIMDGGYGVGTRHDLIRPALIESVHAAGQKVWAWTVNTQTEIDALFDMGVDGVMTDDPRLTIGGG